jgi:chromosome segregation ATPase
LILEKKRAAAEEEAAHLRSILDSNKLNISEVQSKRITELEDQLQETLNNYASLQTKISQWARASKRNQEGRIAAESVQNILEQDVKTLEQQLAESIQAETAARLKFENLNDLLKTAGDDGNITALKASLMHAQSRITELEARVNHSNEPKQYAEKRSSKMNILFDQEVKEKMKYQKLAETYEKKNQELVEEYASISRSNSLKSIEDPQKKSKEVPKRVLEHELEAMRERFAALHAEYEDLVKTHGSALDTLEETETKVADLENTIFQNGDLVQRLNVLAIEKKTLQTALDNYERKDQTKQLAIEMLESHIAKAKAKLAPLEKAAEDLEEMKYTLDEERNAKEALEEKSKMLSEQCEKYRVELMEYAKTNRKPV